MKKVKEGYKMTELGEIPQEWDVISFFNFIEKIIDFRGRTPKKLGMDWGNGNIVALSANNVKMGKIDFNLESYYASEELYQKWMSGNELSKGDILMTMEAPLGNIALVPDDNKYILSQRVVAFKTKKFINNTFMKYMLMSDIVQSQLETLSTGTTAKGINQKNLAKAFVIIPTLKEQEKIASVLWTVDEQIDNVDALIEKNKELKKGLMQTLLTKGIGHTKFKKTEIGEIPEEWEVKILDEISANYKNSIVDGPFGSNLKTSDYVEDGVLVMQSSYITGGKFELRDTRYISKEKALELDRSKVKSGDILMAKIGANFGATEIIPQEISYGILSSNSLKIDLDNKIASNVFYLYVLKYYKKSGIIDKLASTTAQPALSLRSIKELKVVFPNIQEQEKIASILLEVDKNIEEYENIRQNLEKLKKGLMQQLLTGKIRVVL